MSNTNWNTNGVEFSNVGTRPNLSKNIEITSEMEEAYNVSKKSVVNKRTIGAIVFAILVVLYIDVGSNLLLIKFGIVAILGVIALVLYFSGASKGKDVEGEYIENCIEPLANQIVPNMKVERRLSTFPLFGTIYNNTVDENDNFLQKIAKKITSAEKPLGNFLEKNCVIPTFNDNFETGFVLDTLSSNKEGFLFFNAKATTETSDGDGHTHTKIEFKGPIVVMRMSHAVRSGVSLYTSRTSKMFKKEKANGYRKVQTIDTENDEFNQNFEVTAVEDSQAFFVLSPLVMEKLTALKETYGSFGMYIEDDYMIFGFNINRHILAMPEKVRTAKKMNIEETAEELVNLLKMMYDFKDAVDLNFDTQM